MGYIYKITNNINNKIYIGKTLKSIEERWKQHCKDKNRREEEKRPLYDAMNKYGIEHFKIELVEECDYSIINEREIYWIKYFNFYHNGYNATRGGDGKAYIDRKKVIETYKELQNCVETAKKCNIHVDSVYKILEENHIKRKSAQLIIREKQSKSIIMLDLQGNQIKTFTALIDGAKYIRPQEKDDKKLHGIASHIRDVCNKKRNTAYGYKWIWM